MGILEEVGKSFGKKTGKALANKLYGSYADDIRLNTQNTSLKRQSNENYESDQEDRSRTLYNNVLNIEFNPNDKDSIIKDLTTLSSYIDLWLKDSNKNLYIAKSKFNAGLAMLSAVDAKNPMVNYFMNKKSEWDASEKRSKKIMVWYIVGLLGIIAILCLIIFIAS